MIPLVEYSNKLSTKGFCFSLLHFKYDAIVEIGYSILAQDILYFSKKIKA
jgi:hypothetical protein